MEAVYSAGSLTLRADDVATKTAAVMLQALGFLLIDGFSPMARRAGSLAGRLEKLSTDRGAW